MIGRSESQADSSQNAALKEEVEQLRAQLSTLEKLLEVYEEETVDKATRLEKTLAELNDHTERLSSAETTLATLRSIMNSMGDAVVVVDLQGKFLFLNSPAITRLGIRDRDVSLPQWATHWQVYLPDQRTPYPIDQFPLTLAMNGQSLDATELYVKLSDHHLGYWFSVTARELNNADGDRCGGVAVFHNITPLKQVELALRDSETRSRQQALQLQDALDDLQKMQFQLVQTEKMSSLGQLVAGIAHEINNPVNFIHGNIAHARTNVEDLLYLIGLYQTHYPVPHIEIQDEIEEMDLPFLMTDLPKLLKSMKVGSERIQQIVSSLRTFSRMDEAEKKFVDIRGGIESTLLILQSRLKAHNDAGEIEVETHYGDLPAVECYAGQLNQVFMNILGNAIDALEDRRQSSRADATPARIVIKTTLLKNNNHIEIRISDNGVGIPNAVKPKLFDPFFTTKPVGKGTGMGLSISYQIVAEKHGGQLTCESHIGQGTTFTICIPQTQTKKN